MANSSKQLLETLPFHPATLLSFLSFLILLYKWLYTKRNPLPSPPKLPLIGNLHQLGTLPHRNLRSLSEKYGGLMLFSLGSKPTLIVSSADAAEEIMKTHDIVFTNRPNSMVASIVLYNGRDLGFAEYGNYWRKVKSICVLHMLSNKKVEYFRKIRQEEVALMVENIKKSTLSSTPVVNLTDMFTTFTNDVVSRVAFGRKYTGDEGCVNFKDLLKDLSEALGALCVGDFIPWLSWVDELSGALPTARKIANTFDGFLDKVVQEHQDRVDEKTQNDEGQDLADVLIEYQRNDDASLERDTVKALLLDMFAAGTDTTSVLLQWAMSELLINPQIMSKLQEEVRRIAKGKPTIEEDTLKHVNYLKAVLKETLRLHPSLPLLLFRKASQDVKVRGHDIPAGTQVIINAFAIHRNSVSWEEAEEFRPERFLDSEVDFRGQNFNYIPFGAGRRGCPGQSFAVVKAELVLATLVRDFDWKLPTEVDRETLMIEASGVSLHRRHPLVAIPVKHSQ